jgi:two-component system, LytTR family, response regulator
MKMQSLTATSLTTEATIFNRLTFNPAEVVRLEAKSNYTFIWFFNHKKLVTAKVLKQFEVVLLQYGFIRAHRTHLVNRRHISTVHNDGRIIMTDDSEVTISRRMKKQVMKLLREAA